MHIEYEVRVLNINENEIIKKIRRQGGEKIADYNYRRKVYDFKPATKNKWIRLRTDGMKTTLTVKEVEKKTIDGTRELEVEVSDFIETDKILNELGYISKSYQENKRKRFVLNGVELDIDSWPYIPTYLEIEGKSEEDVMKIIEMLDLKDNDVTPDDVQSIYIDYYKIDITKMDNMTFDTVLDEKYRIKDK